MNPLDPRVVHYAPEVAPLVALLAVVNAADAALVVVHALERVEGCPSTEVRLARRLRAALAGSSKATQAYLDYVVELAIPPPRADPDADPF
ncbi:MAG: hypothetical protein R3B40_29470 [Polyangiales bacterium]|nr:hypothetical protein [Myxococcales bacterium]MCB9658210.1 hypothetical protein [Sandaracinaceae bacterium]MCB9658222.1 hypothetical protein [Sandaracinaceae bacterium]